MEKKSIQSALWNLLWVACVSALVSGFLVYMVVSEHEAQYHKPPAAVQKSP
jgi:hypothetical protein